MAKYSIKDLEHLSGIKAHTLRIWEQRYSLIDPKRSDTNIRFYSQSDLKLILNVSLLKANGHKISKIAKMSNEEMFEAVLSVTDNGSDFSDQIYALTLSMIDLDEQRFEKIISSNTLKFGFESTMLNIIYPFLSKIGIMWMTDAINPAQEHFISHLIRQKLIVAIDGQYATLETGAKRCMLFLPEGELHEISLLFANYLMRSRKHKTAYLGQNMPFNDLKMAFNLYKPNYLMTIITTRNPNISPQAYLENLSTEFPDIPILVSGSQVIGQDLNVSDNVILVANPKHLISFIEGSID